ncbi:hypothetical protein GKQ77_31520, partial [Streptomyces sp. BG9H]|nr:hypothetical protein [Streptomyces anatolicus]
MIVQAIAPYRGEGRFDRGDIVDESGESGRPQSDGTEGLRPSDRAGTAEAPSARADGPAEPTVDPAEDPSAPADGPAEPNRPTDAEAGARRQAGDTDEPGEPSDTAGPRQAGTPARLRQADTDGASLARARRGGTSGSSAESRQGDTDVPSAQARQGGTGDTDGSSAESRQTGTGVTSAQLPQGGTGGSPAVEPRWGGTDGAPPAQPPQGGTEG